MAVAATSRVAAATEEAIAAATDKEDKEEATAAAAVAAILPVAKATGDRVEEAALAVAKAAMVNKAVRYCPEARLMGVLRLTITLDGYQQQQPQGGYGGQQQQGGGGWQ